jgi:hypothetical protein
MAWLAWDFLIADDARACWNNSWTDYTKYLGCVMTVLNILAFTKALGVLAKLTKFTPAFRAANEVDKGREV